MKAWAEKFYNSETWRQCRDGFLKSKYYMCERCGKAGDIVTAKIAHHKTYLTKDNICDPSIALSWDNLEALCQDCHNREHHKTNSKRYVFDKSGKVIPPIKNFHKGDETPRGAH